MSKSSKNYLLEAEKATEKAKKECNKKALEIVESWIEQAVLQEELLKNLYFINQNHFQDIIEERAILNKCGYPLCGNVLKNIPQQRYHISTLHNKVFDITEKKNFCSNICYKAARYLKNQLLTSPLWLRDEKQNMLFELLSINELQVSQVEVELRHCNTVKLENESGEIYLGNKNTHELSLKSLQPHQEFEGSNIVGILCKERVQNTTKDVLEENFKFNLDTSNKLININTRSNEISFSNGGNNNMNNVGNRNSKSLQNLQENVTVSGRTVESKRNDGKKEGKVISGSKLSIDCVHSINLITEEIKNENMKITRKEVKKNSNKEINYRNQIVLNSVIKIEQSLRAWFTIDSLCFLYGEDSVKEKLHKKNESLKKQQFVDNNTQVDPHLYERYLMICKKLNIVEIKDQIFDSNLKKTKGVQNPIPDYAQLKEESKRIDFKVKQFYRGDNVVKFQDKSVIEGEDGTQLPLVDIYALKSLRKKIVMDKLFLVYPELQHILELQPVNLTEEIKTLINTFKLSANNITFIPAEWNLISLIIFKLLSIKNQIMYQLLNQKIPNMNLTLLLLSYKLDESYLDKVVMWLTDIDQILKNQN